ncbi:MULTISPECIES: sugar phosphate nucleotidyltransferase [Brevibacillus]|uniref:Mannose-1-phosphate guanylyltransferase n=1 Tax=Brevibacillus parabrevis TaxID=54914 RepID=A0A4Y3PX28_BREPA|nr:MULTISPECIES: sugar phosphate nucleotidyltransferase [Brevibacillus]MBU8713135.1 cupin domain-containing protein [Brevibacillus parabrevis]MDH6348663.1 mannose-1-phosphate guanylyltransferase [Brevibacillus sp. 1238]RNB96978.1 cupin domain-containing protein [Brevibacillus parabrevis]UED70800.1 cupin domain-containing protein [Brevibacillus sp. HD3.3A]GEB35491.1 mannose-1-phosphate guanylyltransferase [Brevibacillus parabrevis]
MKLVLLSGGSGKRLWPLSNDVRSKQFLKLIRNGESEPESMVQRVWRQLAANQFEDMAYISTSQSQVDLIYSQLGPDVPLILEPQKRDTFPAIALIASYLHSVKQLGPDEVVTVMPVDSFVEDHFFQKLKGLETVIQQSGADLALMGVKPTYPSTKYGYVIPVQADNESGSFLQVARFTEKPSVETASQLIAQGALWNCGVFAFRLGYMLQELQKKQLPTDYDQLVARYTALPKISFDYEVVEKAKHVVVVPYAGDWKDLGTWNTLTEEMSDSSVGRVHLEESTNTHVINELDLPIVAIGVSDLVVAASPDGILVAAKDKSHKVKDIASDWSQRPMFEERRWGWYHVLQFQKMNEKVEVLTKQLHLHAGKNLSYQYHHFRSEVWMIVEGEGEFVLNDRLMIVKPGDVVEIPVGAKHAIKAISDLDIIEVQMGSKLVEEDIVRLGMDWNDIVEMVSE